MSINTWPQDLTIYLSGFLLLITFISYRYYLNKHPRLPLPPGPRRLPLIGNLLDFPSQFEWETYQAWGKQYGSDVVHVKVLGTSIVILNSIKACTDLLDKRSSIYSSRPKFTLINKHMGFAWLLPFLQYGPAWKERRRLFQRYFPSKAANSTHKTQEIDYTHRLLLQLLESPEHYLEHIRHFLGGTLHTMTYGTKTKQTNDPYIDLAEQVMVALSDTAIPISGILDSIPWLLPIVSLILSGSPFNKSPMQWKEMVYKFRDEPFYKTQKLMAEGNALDGFVPRSLEDINLSKDVDAQKVLIKDIAGVVFIGGSSTTKAVLLTFFLAMVTFPEAQVRAQEELDRVIGHDRLPDFNDEASLPYLSALIKEVQRWQTPGPIGIPHFLEQDDEYQGYLIPGQSLVIGNAWAILNDEKMYPNSKAFMPERFLKNGQLDPSILDPADVAFGFGRRICPGAHIALSAIWISIASILATFTISKARDENGLVIEPSMKYRSGVTFQPEPFKCAIEPRHIKVESLVRSYVSTFA